MFGKGVGVGGLGGWALYQSNYTVLGGGGGGLDERAPHPAPRNIPPRGSKSRTWNEAAFSRKHKRKKDQHTCLKSSGDKPGNLRFLSAIESSFFCIL